MPDIGFHLVDPPLKVILRTAEYFEAETENGRSLVVLLLFAFCFLFAILGTSHSEGFMVFVGMACIAAAGCAILGYAKRFSFDMKNGIVVREILIFGMTWSVKEYPAATIKSVEAVYYYGKNGGFFLFLNCDLGRRVKVARRSTCKAIREIVSHVSHYLPSSIKFTYCEECAIEAANANDHSTI